MATRRIGLVVDMFSSPRDQVFQFAAPSPTAALA